MALQSSLSDPENQTFGRVIVEIKQQDADAVQNIWNDSPQFQIN